MEMQKTHGESRVRRSVSVNASPEEILRAWCSLEVQQRVLEPVATLVSGSSQMSTWRFDTPARSHEVVWRLVDEPSGHEVRHKIDPIGSLHLSTTLYVARAPADFGTSVSLFVEFHFPGGSVAETVAKMVGMSPHLLAGKTLHRLKALLETGEIPTLHNNPSARDESKEAA
jgi:uncharacterized membrane protein